MRTCTKCGDEKPLSEFYEYKVKGKMYRRHACKTCYLSAHSEWAAKNQARLARYNKKYYRENRQSEIDAAKRWNKENAARKDANTRRHWAKLKDAAYAAYGGYHCQCCGESQPLFLSIDHVHNDGHKFRWKKDGATFGPHSGIKLYRWLRDNGYPPGFQILCMNCNTGKARNGGVCPHQTAKGATTIPKGSRAK